MHRALLICCAVACCGIGALVLPAQQSFAAPMGGYGAGSDASAEGLVSIDVADAPLKSVIQLLMRESGMNIIMAGSEGMDAPITATLTDMPLESVLQNVVRAAGVNYARQADGTFIIGANVEDLQAAAPAAPEKIEVIEPVAPSPYYEPPVPRAAARSRTEVIRLQNISPKDAMVALGAVRVDEALASVEAPQFVRNGMATDLIEFDPVDPIIRQGNQPVNVNIFPAAPTSDTANPDVANRATDPTSTLDQYSPRRPTSPTQGPTGQPRTGTTGTTTTGESQALLGDSIDAIFAYPEQNSLLVRGEDEDIEDLKNLISLIDLPPRQVMIKAEFVEVATTVTQRLGIDWMLTRPNYGFQTNFGTGGNVLAYVQTGNLTSTLRAELTQGGGKVVNAPIISTLNNRRATITIAQTDWVFSPVIETTQTGNITRSIPQPIQYQSYLDVLPQINGDNSITLTMRPQITDQSGIARSPEGQELPKTTSQYLSTARRVGNGETIVVGGFIKKNDNSSGTKVPILGDLPIIGSLFRSKFDIKSDTETLIFITPTIVEEQSSGQAIGVISP